ncbi:hypothetical protein C2S52_011663 [Perilla frutescens var. hirtella]|nr:hypothetical protein C2S52_011663 [Perilla frutescens var. hirtella]KAH6785703.1 hypothetical protein C2S51_038158 [Perilla frutescens var. frutescens]
MAKPSRYEAEFDDRYGIVMPYLRKFVFEDKEEFDYTPYYESDDEDIYGVAEPHEAILKYLKQIRESFLVRRSFHPVNLAEAKLNKKRSYTAVMEAAHFAIREINAETSGKTYKFVELKKAVLTINFLRLLTITVKEVAEDAVKEVVGDTDTNVDVDAGAVVRTIQAIVYFHFADGLELEQWRIKPDPAAEDA